MQNDISIKEDELRERIQSLVSAVRADNNPEELERIKKIIKKNVPFTLRGYFSAYLLRLLASSSSRAKAPVREYREAKKPQQQNTAPQQVKEEKSEKKPQQRVIPQDAKTLYINLGKIGHVYARDLVSLFANEAGISKDEIYLIRLHDKYSFVTVSEANCAKAIEALQGKSYKNRTIQINISNKEKAAGGVTSEPDANSAAL